LQATPAYREARAAESLAKVYKCHYPHRPTLTARGVRRSPLHDRLAARGACFRDVSGWEGADWFAGPGQAAELGELSWGRHPNWWGRWAAEHAACRDACVLLDMSFMSKFLVRGRDAGALLDWLATARVDGSEGTITYTQLLSPRGTLEADLTMTKLPADCAGVGGLGGEPGFLVVATDTAHRHVESLLRRGAEEWGVAHGARVGVADVTGGLAQINLQGPSSRALLARLTAADVSDSAFPFRGARTIAIGCAPVLATRITYVGELGYELFVPTEAAVHVYDRITAEGEAAGLTHAGLKALGSLRMEKGYRDYGHDLDNCDTLLEAGLGFTADYDKPGGFVGMEACLAQRRAGGPVQRLVQVGLAEPEPLLYHGEVVYRNSQVVGDVRAASYGHTLGGAVGLSMVRAADGERVSPAWISDGDWEVDVAGVRVPARASLRPMYDPKNERVRL
jgi:4-methylaminobutanoate oxidase (formaldehyde-forming)